MVSSVRIDDAAIQGSIRRLSRHFKVEQKLVVRNIGIALRDYIRSTVDRGGRKRPHAPLSDWTRARTGRRKPLRGISRGISYRSNDEEVVIYYSRETDGWDLTLHHTGWRIPARVGRMVVPLAGGGRRVFMKAKSVRVPGREIWPTQKEVRDLVSGIVTRWIDSGVKMSWRP
jgi:hypothetical protein